MGFPPPLFFFTAHYQSLMSHWILTEFARAECQLPGAGGPRFSRRLGWRKVWECFSGGGWRLLHVAHMPYSISKHSPWEMQAGVIVIWIYVRSKKTNNFESLRCFKIFNTAWSWILIINIGPTKFHMMALCKPPQAWSSAWALQQDLSDSPTPARHSSSHWAACYWLMDVVLWS